MASLSSIRAGLKANLATISGLRTFDTVPDQVPVPCAVVGGPERIDFDATMGRGIDRYTIPIRVYVSRASERAGQASLDAFLAGSGASSVKAAIESDKDLGGAADTTRCVAMREYGIYEVNGVAYLGFEVVVDVLAAG